MVNGLVEFLKKTPSAFHAIKNITDELAAQGYTRLNEGDKWQLKAGGKYYVTRNLSSVLAFIVPEGGITRALLTASHCDSPVFKIKENAELEVKQKYIQLDTERYGGVILSSWLDRPLSFAGRVLVKTQRGIETRLVNLDEDALVIPNVAPHMNRKINEGFTYNLQTDMVPLYGDFTEKGSFRQRVADMAGVAKENLLGTDLFLYSRTQPAVWGPKQEYVSAGRLDDLECAYTATRAFLTCTPAEGSLPMLAVFDNEEVGSTTKQGADSSFLTDTLFRICLAMGLDREDYCRMQANSIMLSCDNAHALHPNHPEFFDAVNAVYMNEGIVLKESANQKYTSDGVSKALFRFVLEKANVPFQFYANRSDVAGGGTLGNISNRHFSLNTVDIGLAQLAMHSAYETAGSKDVEYMINGMKAFYECSSDMIRDGEFIIK